MPPPPSATRAARVGESITFGDEVVDAYPIRISVLINQLDAFLKSFSLAEDSLPHPDAQFVLAPQEYPVATLEAPPDLLEFVGYFEKPTSARKLARKTRLPLDIVSGAIYRLRLRGVIVPHARAQAAKGQAAMHSGILARLARWLGGGGSWTRA